MKVALLGALLVACSAKEPAAPPRAPGDGIELVDAGNLPHRPLRYHLTKGATTTLELAMDLELAMGPRGGTMPTIVMRMEIRADDVLADGSAKIRTKIVSAAARERKDTAISTDIMNQQTALLVGLELTATLSPRGQLTNSKVELAGKDLPPSLASQIGQLNQSLEQVAMPLPEGPVGPGAKWRNRKSVTQNNVAMATVTTVEVVAIDGDRVTFKSSSDVTGADQKVDIEGTQVAISKVGGGGSGGGVIDLGKMVMAGEFQADFHFDMAAQEQSAPMKMNLALHLRPLDAIEAAAPPPAPPEELEPEPAPPPARARKPAPKKKPVATPVEDPGADQGAHSAP